MPQPIEIHFWPTPNGYKITIACEEMGLPYTMVPVNIGRGDQFKDSFQAISPNGRMPAIVDPEGPDGKPISIFESGAILQYLGRKTGQFYPADERGRVEVDEWLFWQMAGLGPMAGQAHHFRGYAPAMLPDRRFTAYGAARYTNEVHRLYGVLNKRLEGREYMAGAYSIADMATWPWVRPWRMQGIVMEEFPNLKAWNDRMNAREAVRRAIDVGEGLRRSMDLGGQGQDAEAARRILFGQRAR
ncbi:MAG TPA: glutathione S-transferase N-terminal domain-containing protein [Phenylobacterium sp.]